MTRPPCARKLKSLSTRLTERAATSSSNSERQLASAAVEPDSNNRLSCELVGNDATI